MVNSISSGFYLDNTHIGSNWGIIQGAGDETMIPWNPTLSSYSIQSGEQENSPHTVRSNVCGVLGCTCGQGYEWRDALLEFWVIFSIALNIFLNFRYLL